MASWADLRYIDFNLVGFEAVGTQNTALHPLLVEANSLRESCSLVLEDAGKERPDSRPRDHCWQHSALGGKACCELRNRSRHPWNRQTLSIAVCETRCQVPLGVDPLFGESLSGVNR